MVTDPISDFIIRLKNASAAKQQSISVPHSKFVEAVAYVLKRAGYVGTVEVKGQVPAKVLEVSLLYPAGVGARIHGTERVSKPSRRVYLKATDIRVYRSGYGNTLLSTPKGVMTDNEAKKQKVGGEVLFKIW